MWVSEGREGGAFKALLSNHKGIGVNFSLHFVDYLYLA